MLQVYDRVLTTGSVETLILLSGIAVFLLAIFLFADAGRRRVLARAAETLNAELSEPALARRVARGSAVHTALCVGVGQKRGGRREATRPVNLPRGRASSWGGGSYFCRPQSVAGSTHGPDR